MKKLSAFLAVVLLCGCSLTPDRIAKNTLDSVKATAESTIKVAAVMYNEGQITDQQWADAKDAYHKVEVSCKVAAAGLGLVTNASQAEALAADSKRLVAALVALVDSFRPKPVAWMSGGLVWAAC